MLKVFYGLSNDIVDRSAGNTGIIDLLKNINKCNIYPEISQIKGEKIDIAYVFYSEQLLSQLGEQNIKKISIFSKGDDDIVIPKNFVKYSSELITSMGGKYYNIVLNNRNYKTDNEIIVVGDDEQYQDVIKNVYSLFGNVIVSNIKKYKVEVDAVISSRHLPNSGGIYYNVYAILEGLKRCVIKKNIVKVRPDEYFADLNPIFAYLQNNNKIVVTNAYMPKISKLKFSIGDHLIAGKYEQMMKMYSGALGMLNNKVNDMRKKLRIEYTPEQIMVVGYLHDRIDFIGAKNDNYIKELMTKNFHVIPINEFGYFMIPCGKFKLIAGKQIDKELYNSVCEINSIDDI